MPAIAKRPLVKSGLKKSGQGRPVSRGAGNGSLIARKAGGGSVVTRRGRRSAIQPRTVSAATASCIGRGIADVRAGRVVPIGNFRKYAE